MQKREGTFGNENAVHAVEDSHTQTEKHSDLPLPGER
jgi:hypothetical protein